MTIYAVKRTKKATNISLLQIIVTIGAGLVLFSFLIILFAIAYDLRFRNQIYSGVSVGGINLSGYHQEEAVSALTQSLSYPQTGKIVFQEGEKVWVATPADLGLSLDSGNSAQTAFKLGRSGNPFTRLADKFGAWYLGKDLSPLLTYDERIAQSFIEAIASEVDQPTVEASLSIDGLDVVVVPGQIGRQVNIQATLEILQEQVRNLTDGLVPLVIDESSPAILDVTQQAEIARGILSEPLTLFVPDGETGLGPWLIPQDQLARMLVIERVQSPEEPRYQVGLSSESLNTYLVGLTGDINRYARNARFMFNDDTRLLEVIQPAVIGRELHIDASVRQINDAVIQGEHRVPLSISSTNPQVGDNATGEELGITELVVAHTSYFRGSTTERLHNIETAAANFHGLLVPPGTTFSMASAMGNVSLDNGYAEAWIIFGGRTIKGVGGGVCQVSTTLFRTAFFGGFPIIERHPHAYRVSYYEQTSAGINPNLSGLDATVFVPLVDFQFMNDTPYWLLMETYFYPTSRSLTWKFYSTSDGRTVEWESTGPQNIVEPPDPAYEENPELDKGEIVQVDWAAEGADVRVTRNVYRDGQLLFSDVFNTHYLPWRDVFQYGPGTNLNPNKPKWKTRGWLEWLFPFI